jgi:branched-chain amino acid transport system substrate-binding protein
MKCLRLLYAAFLMASIVGCAQAPIKIGFVAELSGPQGALGQDQYDAFMLAVDANGGKLGGVPVQVLREDSQLNPAVALQIVDRLITQEKVPIITGLTFANVMMAVYRKTVDQEVFLIGSNAGPSPVAGAQCSPYFFSTSWQSSQQAEVMGKYAADKGYKRVVAMAPDYQAGRDLLAGFKRYYRTPLAAEVYTSLTQQDYAKELDTLRAATPDAVFVFYPGGLGVSFVKQFAAAGLKGKLPLLNASTTDGINLAAQAEDAVGALIGTVWGPDFTNPVSRKFVADFEARYKRIPSQYAAQAYDSALLLDAAIGKVKGNVANKPAFQAALKSAEFKSLRGDFAFNTNGFPVQDFHVFEAVRDSSNRYTLKTVATPLKAERDAYFGQCPLK